METIIIKQAKRFRNHTIIISFLASVIFLAVTIMVIDLSVFLAVFLGIIGLLYLFSFIKNTRVTQEPAEIILSDREVFFNSIGTFAWDEINAFEVNKRTSHNEYNEKSTATHLYILLENKKSFYFQIDLLEKNENEIMALFMTYKPVLRNSHF
ncbi:hypothetical protein SD960_00920 [Flavobacterium sp. MMLR14_040]|uniref:hypothetical protein n=1 Tax=Flavobacterium sp. MMLR14_040 TaxID=3093843 RepID=UPI0029903A56|nr:hypothetical protein [Flavobacterium sp. MMLR14_040]MDW8848635.1 hypothetical protein [Flavobacterium sp. MMLR14_040]